MLVIGKNGTRFIKPRRFVCAHMSNVCLFNIKRVSLCKYKQVYDAKWTENNTHEAGRGGV